MMPVSVKITGIKVPVADAVSHLNQSRPIHLFDKANSNNLQGVSPKGVVLDIVSEDNNWMAVVDVGKHFSAEGKVFELFVDKSSGFRRISLLMSNAS